MTEQEEENQPTIVMTRLASKRQAQIKDSGEAEQNTASAESERETPVASTGSSEPSPVVDNYVEVENTDTNEATEDVQGSEVNAVQGEPQEAQEPTNSGNWSNRKNMLLEKKAKRSELDKMARGQ